MRRSNGCSACSATAAAGGPLPAGVAAVVERTAHDAALPLTPSRDQQRRIDKMKCQSRTRAIGLLPGLNLRSMDMTIRPRRSKAAERRNRARRPVPGRYSTPSPAPSRAGERHTHRRARDGAAGSPAGQPLRTACPAIARIEARRRWGPEQGHQAALPFGPPATHPAAGAETIPAGGPTRQASKAPAGDSGSKRSNSAF